MVNYDAFIDELQNNKEKRIVTSELCRQSFLAYILTVFYIINCSKFKLKPFHKKIIKKLEDIVNSKNKKRNLALCLPVGAGKSLIIEYFITWCFARSINTTFCYVSFSDRLINKLSKECKDIIEHPIWKLIFGVQLKKDDRQRVNFSFEGAKNRTGLTAGTTGGAITGLDAGNPNIEGFSGALIIDDPMDVADWRYENARKEVITFYDDKLATRRRTTTTPTILVMQRIHLDDLIGWIKKNEADLWDILEIPALNEDGTSFWEERYPVKELRHIELVNNYKFMSQYQQQPVTAGGSVIKTEWFGYYPVIEYDYTRLVISADTAMTVKEASDYTCLMVGGVTQNGKLHIVDMVHGRFEFPELKQQLVNLYNKYQYTDGITTSCNEIFIENKASGIQLVQELQANTGLPIIPVEVTKDKLTRVEEILSYIASGNVLLPVDKSYGFNPTLLNECAEFNREQTQVHDDITDALAYLIANTIANRTVTLFDCMDDFEKLYR